MGGHVARRRVRPAEAHQSTSDRTIALFDGGSNENSEENSTTDAFVAISGGGHMVDFEFFGVSAGTTEDETVLNVLFVPFGADSTQIAP